VIRRGEVHTSGEEAGELPLLPCLILCLLTSRRDCGLQVFDTGEMPITAHVILLWVNRMKKGGIELTMPPLKY
jgi:hypothetical protein